MGKRKTRGSQHHDRNQTSSGGFHVRKYMQFEPQPTAIGFTGYSVTLPFARSADCGRMFVAKNRAKSYLIFARMPSISFRRKARKVWLLTLPREAILSENALIVSSSGA